MIDVIPAGRVTFVPEVVFPINAHTQRMCGSGGTAHSKPVVIVVMLR